MLGILIEVNAMVTATIIRAILAGHFLAHLVGGTLGIAVATVVPVELQVFTPPSAAGLVSPACDGALAAVVGIGIQVDAGSATTGQTTDATCATASILAVLTGLALLSTGAAVLGIIVQVHAKVVTVIKARAATRDAPGPLAKSVFRAVVIALAPMVRVFHELGLAAV